MEHSHRRLGKSPLTSETTPQKKSLLLTPKSAVREGSTRSYPRYDIDSEPLLQSFISNLTSFDGRKRSLREARQICSDISKYLAFANPLRCSWESLNNEDTMKDYVTKLERDGVGSDGIVKDL